MATGQRHVPAALGLIYQPRSYVERMDLGALFPKLQPLEVELGSGDGSFLVQWAQLHPEHNFIGVERLLGRLRKLDRKGSRAGLTNLRALRIEASYFLEYMTPATSLCALHIYFPDPWPKRKQRKNRLVNQRFAEAAATALAPGGLVFLRTDDPDYFAQMNSVFGADVRFHAEKTPDELIEVLTDFERGFLARGVRTLRSAWQRIR
jgi:tRNA (guanine-N7-)-methyltransferase